MRPEEHEETADAAALRARLQHVYWIGGGSGAGKSTIAQRIASQHGLHVYSTDEVMPDHVSRGTPEDAPYLSRFKTMNMDERWANRSPQTMLETFPWFRGEAFGLIVEDVLRLPAGTGVIAEGFRLLPHLVSRCSPSPTTQSGSCRRPSSAEPPSTAEAGRSRARPAILNWPDATYSSATGCSPTASSRKRRASNCPSSRSTPR